ncbi:MAG: ubiquinone/menaquinone biosynthesis methyltransferase [Anaerolineae bacterium]|nr:ubiquinone/menaquinone biosynthesis methyltransferase [Anaerolineae bacterium]
MTNEVDQRKRIRNLFARIAAQYDRVNHIISLGRDQKWRAAALSKATITPGSRLLDVATGTGDIALLAKASVPELNVIGTDLTPAMLLRAKEKDAYRSIPWVLGDGLRLAFAHNTFDAVISGFMMRNVPDVQQALGEQLRVVRPGGCVICLEMTWPQWIPMKWLFKLYFYSLPPLLGRLLTGDRQAYQYLPRSVERFLTPQDMASEMEAVGFRRVSWQLMMFGTVAIHTGTK